MRITQEPSFSPIIITLETAEEANDFVSLIDQVDSLHAHSGWTPDKLTKRQKHMLKVISDTFTDRIGLR